MGDILCAVTDQRQCLLCDGGNDQLAGFPFRQNLQGHRVNDFCDKVIFIDVHASERVAFTGNTGSDELAHPVVFSGKQAKGLVNLGAHGLGGAFTAKTADPQV